VEHVISPVADYSTACRSESDAATALAANCRTVLDSAVLGYARRRRRAIPNMMSAAPTNDSVAGSGTAAVTTGRHAPLPSPTLPLQLPRPFGPCPKIMNGVSDARAEKVNRSSSVPGPKPLLTFPV
jgi:hypothetical protein